ncbi:MAG: diguanylate cyclase [Solirubrobacterales bacterium]|nr:diguanylate cyclase [Solirubrobacterales bacterium]
MENGTHSDRLLAIIEAQNEIIATELGLEAVMQIVLSRAIALTGADAAVVERVEGEEMVHEAVAGTAETYPGVRVRRDSSLSGLCAETGRVLRSDDTATDPRVDRETCLRLGAGSMLCAPLRHDDAVAGVLRVYAAHPHAFAAGDERTVEVLSGLIEARMTHASRFEDGAETSRRDALTQLLNRNAYDERLVHEGERARRYQHALALVLLDLDGFKAVNDELGHAAGDGILREVAAVLAGSRFADVIFRIGGDEFAIVLPETDLYGAEAAAERLVMQIAAAALGDGRVTASWGAAAGDGDPLALHERADWALLASKERRRDSFDLG